MNNLLEEIKNNKKIFLICGILIIICIVIIIYFNSNKNNYDNFEYSYEGINNYEANTFIPVYVTEEDLVKKYLNDYKNNMIGDIESAYYSLNEKYRDKRFGSLDNYKKYVSDNLTSSMLSLEIEEYSKSNINGYRVYSIIDRSGNQYIFKEISIMNYEVYLDDDTVEIN